MRLLNSQTLEFATFDGDDEVPAYAILSHTWGNGEVTFQDMNTGNAASKEGMKKINFAAEQARDDDIGYFWVDTCCIDKTSSSELSESLNSMFSWYQHSTICYVYLSDAYIVDVSGEAWLVDTNFINTYGTLIAIKTAPRPPPDRLRKEVLGSRWFTRGWTLQELIAPKHLRFYSHGWHFLGLKDDWAIAIADEIGIPVTALTRFDPQHFSIAQKMSWAATRQTKRKEDRAYSLLGLFGVYMPMLYGEGDRAFMRLQEEIMKISDDRSIFCWASLTAPPSTYRGLLARGTIEFAKSNGIPPIFAENCSPYQLTNRGMMIELQFLEIDQDEVMNEFVISLSGSTEREPGYGLVLARINDDTYARIDVCSIWTASDSASYKFGQKKSIFVRQTPLAPRTLLPNRLRGYTVQEQTRLAIFYSVGHWDFGDSTKPQTIRFSFDGKNIIIFTLDALLARLNAHRGVESFTHRITVKIGLWDYHAILRAKPIFSQDELWLYFWHEKQVRIERNT